MSILNVICPQCGNSVSASDVNISTMVARCSRCDVLFSVDAQSGALSSQVLTDAAPPRPSGLSHEQGAMGELIIRRRWFHVALFALLFFCIAWDAFLIFWYSMALFGMGDQGGFEWIAIIFPIGHVAVGVGLTYYVVAGFLNSTWITVDFSSLNIRHAPIPWRGNRRFGREEIKAIELEFGGASNRNGYLTMTISIHHVDDRQVVLLSGLPSQQADYIAWHLADALKVPLNRKDGAMFGMNQVPAFVQKFLHRR